MFEVPYAGLVRIRLDLAYDGTHFRGWARQPGLRTVQGTLEDAIARILGGEPRLVVAGRTDAGVHATGQVAHLDLSPEQVEALISRGSKASDPVAGMAARLRGVLGAYPDVTVSRTAVALPGFDARFSAVWRRYEYRLADRQTRDDPLQRHRTTAVRSQLDVGAMHRAAGTLTGLHDFATFCKPRPGATTIRTLLEYSWQRQPDGVITATVASDAFCHSMVRALVGACVAVGAGRLAEHDLVTLRDARQRVPEVKVLAARGLTLTEVGYSADQDLAERAAQTRARRDAF